MKKDNKSETITTTFTLPPTIIQYFSATLLSVPCPVFGRPQDSSDLWAIYQYIKTHLQRKMLRYEKWDKGFLELEQQFLELYERITTKEKERPEKKDHKTQKSFYSIETPDKTKRKLYDGLKFCGRHKRISSYCLRQNNKI